MVTLMDKQDRFVRIRPKYEVGWLYLKESDVYDYLGYYAHEDFSIWEYEKVPNMTQEEYHNLPEFDGW